MNAVFSAYWYVDNNTKFSAGKHLKCVADKGLDFFFAEKKYFDLNTVNLKFGDLPSTRFINNLSKLKTQHDNVFLKFTHPI